MPDMEKLSEHVMVEILSKLPPESLVRFKCVSKSWYALINDPSFGSSLQNKNILLMSLLHNDTHTLDCGEIRLSFLRCPLTFNDYDHTSIGIEDIEFPYLGEGQFFFMVGHSHGLVCLCGIDNANHIFIFNPAIRELHKLPPSIFLNSSNDTDGLNLFTNAVGFGYDLKSEDFKVVRLVVVFPSNRLNLNFVDDDLYNHSVSFRVEVYNLKRDKWREIQTPVPGHVYWMPSFEMYYRGFYYWWGISKDVGKSYIILTFDMSEEVFDQILVPKSFKRGGNRSLGVLNGSIVLFDFPNSVDKRSFDVWEMVKSRGVVSWSKLFTIGPILNIRGPLAFVDSKQLLMYSAKGEIILYNIKTQQFKHLSPKGVHLPSENIMSIPTIFVKSLISVNVNGGNKYT